MDDSPDIPVPVTPPQGPPAVPDAWRPSARAPRPSPVWIHVVLLGATAFTMTVAGAFWEGAFNAVASDSITAMLRHTVRLVILHPTSLLPGIPFAACLLAILGSHEMGHYLACRRHGIPATLPFFIPAPSPFGTFGAVIRIRGVIPHRAALFDVAAAGPLAGFAVALPILVVGLLRSFPLPKGLPEGGLNLGSPLLSMALERWIFGPGTDIAVGSVYLAGWFGMLITSMNLFPVGQLDGGHAAYALSRRFHRGVARITVAGLIVLVVLQFVFNFPRIPAYTLWCAILLFMRDRHPPLSDEVVPLDRRRVAGLVLLWIVFVLSFIPVPMSF